MTESLGTDLRGAAGAHPRLLHLLAENVFASQREKDPPRLSAGAQEAAL